MLEMVSIHGLFIDQVTLVKRDNEKDVWLPNYMTIKGSDQEKSNIL